MKAVARSYFVCCVIALTFAGRADAGFTIVQPTGTNYVLSANGMTQGGKTWTSKLNPAPATYISAASADFKTVVEHDFSDWNFTYATGGLSGELAIEQYKAYTDVNDGGAVIKATYERAGDDPDIGNLRWIQMVTYDQTSEISGDVYKQFIDPENKDDFKPFYWTDTEIEDGGYVDEDAGTLWFDDMPHRAAPTLESETYIWTGELMLASWAGGSSKDVTVYDGIKYGFKLYVQPQPGGTLAMASVPEPGGLSLLSIGVLVGIAKVLSRRRTLP